MIDAHDASLFELTAPTSQLAIDVAVVTCELTQARLVDVNAMQLRQSLGQMIANRRTSSDVEGGFGLSAVSQNGAVHELHHVERSLVDSFVGAESERARNGDSEGVERANDGVLSHHVVSRWQDVAQRGTPKRVGFPGSVAGSERQIRP